MKNTFIIFINENIKDFNYENAQFTTFYLSFELSITKL